MFSYTVNQGREMSARKETHPSADAVRDCFLAELRCGRLRAEIAVTDITAVGVALKHHCITVEQAMEMLHARDALPYLFVTEGGAA